MGRTCAAKKRLVDFSLSTLENQQQDTASVIIVLVPRLRKNHMKCDCKETCNESAVFRHQYYSLNGGSDEPWGCYATVDGLVQRMHHGGCIAA